MLPSDLRGITLILCDTKTDQHTTPYNMPIGVNVNKQIHRHKKKHDHWIKLDFVQLCETQIEGI